MIRALLKFTQVIDAFSERLGTISMYLVMVTVIVGFVNVVLRYMGRFVGVRLTSNLFIEMQWYLYSLVFFFGFAYILKHGINVRVDFWYAELSQRTKAIIDVVGHFLSLIPFCILGIVVTIDPVLRSWGRLPNGTWSQMEMSPDPSGLPRAPIKSMIIVAFVTLLLQGIAEVIKLIGILRNEDVFVESTGEHEAPLRIE